ncbi:eCIS core domain-containing protein [Lentzea sp. NEAU-D7]|uniref:eCIS core domain-containing protein n=1 Tax=Lentzea sp. NEAU-D7 TaxID=2994667 RepID=UPI00224A9B56|nr:DUF4157 domain-containing protein [Lentzea sp. NEAU-D7]MCX2954580.1 DUF4157 domain-containing protein [Lentzea sp. NEAU-D7]
MLDHTRTAVTEPEAASVVMAGRVYGTARLVGVVDGWQASPFEPPLVPRTRLQARTPVEHAPLTVVTDDYTSEPVAPAEPYRTLTMPQMFNTGTQEFDFPQPQPERLESPAIMDIARQRHTRVDSPPLPRLGPRPNLGQSRKLGLGAPMSRPAGPAPTSAEGALAPPLHKPTAPPPVIVEPSSSGTNRPIDMPLTPPPNDVRENAPAQDDTQDRFSVPLPAETPDVAAPEGDEPPADAQPLVHAPRSEHHDAITEIATPPVTIAPRETVTAPPPSAVVPAPEQLAPERRSHGDTSPPAGGPHERHAVRPRDGGNRVESVPTELVRLFREHHGVDVADVRINRGPEVSTSARAHGARAFTARQEVFLPMEVGSTHAGTGRSLLGHELVHVVQQRMHGGAPSSGSAAAAVMELEAGHTEHWLASETSIAPPPLSHRRPALGAGHVREIVREQISESSAGAAAPMPDFDEAQFAKYTREQIKEAYLDMLNEGQRRRNADLKREGDLSDDDIARLEALYERAERGENLGLLGLNVDAPAAGKAARADEEPIASWSLVKRDTKAGVLNMLAQSFGMGGKDFGSFQRMFETAAEREERKTKQAASEEDDSDEFSTPASKPAFGGLSARGAGLTAKGRGGAWGSTRGFAGGLAGGLSGRSTGADEDEDEDIGPQTFKDVLYESGAGAMGMLLASFGGTLSEKKERKLRSLMGQRDWRAPSEIAEEKEAAAAAKEEAEAQERARLNRIPADQIDIEDLANHIYDQLRSRLRMELLIDRERAGLLTDFR